MNGSFAFAYQRALQAVIYAGEVDPRGMKTREVLNYHLEVEDLQANVLISKNRGLNYRFMVAEWLWILLGMNDVETLARYNSKMRNFSDDGVYLAGAYGPLWTAQRTYLTQVLLKDPDTRQAVMTIWRPNPAPSKDIPCTISLQFLFRDNRLNCIANMRSSDLWLGLPYDFFTFSQITNYLAAILNVRTGWLAMNLGSAHLYEEHWGPALKFVDQWDFSTASSPTLTTPVPEMVVHALMQPERMSGDDLLDSVWLRYAEALLAKSSDEALTCLLS